MLKIKNDWTFLNPTSINSHRFSCAITEKTAKFGTPVSEKKITENQQKFFCT
jgi:hypothetical protein